MQQQLTGLLVAQQRRHQQQTAQKWSSSYSPGSQAETFALSSSALITASHSCLLLPPFASASPIPTSPICPYHHLFYCTVQVFRASCPNPELVAYTHQLPSPQKGRHSSISTFALIPIQGENLKLDTPWRTEVHKLKKKESKKPTCDSSAGCVIWKGIFLHC